MDGGHARLISLPSFRVYLPFALDLVFYWGITTLPSFQKPRLECRETRPLWQLGTALRVTYDDRAF